MLEGVYSWNVKKRLFWGVGVYSGLKGVEVAECAEFVKRYCVEDFVLSLFRMSGGVAVVEVGAQKRGSLFIICQNEYT